MSSRQIRSLIQNHSSRYIKYFVLVIAFGVIASFQNCGVPPSSRSDILPLDSPFYLKRVHLSEKALAEAKLDEKNQLGVTVVVDNQCAVEQCQQAGSENAVVCELIETGMIKELSSNVQAYSLSVPSDTTEESFERQMQANQADHDCVIGVALNQEYSAGQAATNDPVRNMQYHHDLIQTDEALNFFTGLQPVRVGIIDTGVDNTHEDLSSLSGFIDWGAMTAGECATICNFHGTFVAGIIGSKRNNSKGGYGIAPNAQMRSVRVGNAAGSITTTELYNALNWFVIADTIEILNLSLGGSSTFDATVQDAIVRLIAKDVVVVVAAGNDSQRLDIFPKYPASFNYDGQINVASASPSTIDPTVTGLPNATGAVALDPYSNYSSGLVHIAAPGRGIYSTTLSNGYGSSSGTSFSTPMVVGALAVLKGYLKAKGYPNPPAALLKQLLLDGSKTLPVLNDKVNGGKYLNMMELKAAAERFLLTMNSSPVQIALVSSETLLVGTKKVVRVRIEVTGGSSGQLVRVYTNKAFLDPSYTGLSCQIVQARQFCDFDVNFDSLVTDPGIYFAMTSSTNSFVAELDVPKESLNFGVRATASLIGEISNVRAVPGYFHAEGWSCLVGFGDPIDIEVRSGSATGPIVRYLKTVRQARGSFYDRCAAASVFFGFTFVVPDNLLNTSTRYFFKAIHQGTGKSINLPVASYQPGYKDTKPAQYVNSLFVDPLSIKDTPVIKITRREFNNWILTLEGSACYPTSKRPAVVQIKFSDDQILSLIPEIWDAGQFAVSNPLTTAAAASYSSESYDWDFQNAGVVKSSAHLGSMVCSGVFSDITYPCSYSDGRAPASIQLLQPLPSIRDIELTAPGTAPLNPAKSIWISSGAVESGGIEVTPNLSMGDGCPYPSGFKVNLDVRNYISKLSLKSVLMYRADKVTRSQAIDILGAQAAMFQPQPDRTFNQLRFRSRAFDVTIGMPGSATRNVFLKSSTFQSPYLSHNKVASQVGGVWKQYQLGEPWWIDVWTWKDFPELLVNPPSATTLSQVYITPQVTLKQPASGRLFFGLQYTDGESFGQLGTDFVVEFTLNGSSQWYVMQFHSANSNRSTTTGLISGMLWADVDLPVTANSIQVRIRANNKSKLKISNLGFGSQ